MQVEFSQRSDGKWVKWGYVPHPNYKPEAWNLEAKWFPQIWVPIKIYDHVLKPVV